MIRTSRYSLIGHPPTIRTLHRYVEYLKPGYGQKPMNDNLLKTIFSWTPSFKAFDISARHPGFADDVEGMFIVSTFFPEMLYKSRQKVIDKIQEAIRVSEEGGAKIAALGGFTSIADGQQGQIVSEATRSMAVTNGSTLTAALTITGVEKACQRIGLKLADAHVSIIGATGSIGRTCAKHFLDKVGKITLSGLQKEKLKRFFKPHPETERAGLLLTTDNQRAVAEADVVICATSATRSIFSPDSFKSGAVVCDVGFPKTVSAGCSKRSDIIAFLGGLARMPWRIDEAPLWGLGSKKVVYGCFAEAMALAMEGSYDMCTVGLQEIDLENVYKIREIAFKHGFEVAPFFNAGKYYSSKDFEHIKTIRERAGDRE